jgi:hypothetical protein
MNWLSSSILAIPYGPTLVRAGLRRTGSPSQTDLQQIASLMDDLPEFIYLTGLKGYRFIANTTDWTIRHSHGDLRQQIVRLHGRPTPSTRCGGGCVRDCHWLARHSYFTLYVRYPTLTRLRRRARALTIALTNSSEKSCPSRL